MVFPSATKVLDHNNIRSLPTEHSLRRVSFTVQPSTMAKHRSPPCRSATPKSIDYGRAAATKANSNRNNMWNRVAGSVWPECFHKHSPTVPYATHPRHDVSNEHAWRRCVFPHYCGATPWCCFTSNIRGKAQNCKQMWAGWKSSESFQMYTFYLRTANLPGQCNQTVNALFHRKPLPGNWLIHKEVVHLQNKSICLWINSVFTVGHGQGKVKDRVFWPGCAGMQLAKSRTVCLSTTATLWRTLQHIQQCCWWPHSDQTRYGSICCLHYWWAFHTLYWPDCITWNYESGP